MIWRELIRFLNRHVAVATVKMVLFLMIDNDKNKKETVRQGETAKVTARDIISISKPQMILR